MLYHKSVKAVNTHKTYSRKAAFNSKKSYILNTNLTFGHFMPIWFYVNIVL